MWPESLSAGQGADTCVHWDFMTLTLCTQNDQISTIVLQSQPFTAADDYYPREAYRYRWSGNLYDSLLD